MKIKLKKYISYLVIVAEQLVIKENNNLPTSEITDFKNHLLKKEAHLIKTNFNLKLNLAIHHKKLNNLKINNKDIALIISQDKNINDLLTEIEEKAIKPLS